MASPPNLLNIPNTTTTTTITKGEVLAKHPTQREACTQLCVTLFYRVPFCLQLLYKAH